MTSPDSGQPDDHPSDAGISTPRAAPAASNAVLRRALVWGGILSLAIAIVGAVVGGIVGGPAGVWSALIGAAMAFAFLGITAVSILFANRFSSGPLFGGIFFAIVLGGWLVKFVVFVVLAVLLRHQSWIDPPVLFLTVIIGIVASLVVDVVVMTRSRIPYVETRL